MQLKSFKTLLKAASMSLLLSSCNDGPDFTVCFVYAKDNTFTCRDPQGNVTARTIKAVNNYACFSSDDIQNILSYYKRNTK